MKDRFADKTDLDVRATNDRIFKCRTDSESTKGGERKFAASASKQTIPL